MNEIVRLDWDALYNCIDHALYQGQGEGKPTTDNVVDWIEREAVKPVDSVPDGWFPFGSHVDFEGKLKFSEELDEDGLPKWERHDD